MGSKPCNPVPDRQNPGLFERRPIQKIFVSTKFTSAINDALSLNGCAIRPKWFLFGCPLMCSSVSDLSVVL